MSKENGGSAFPRAGRYTREPYRDTRADAKFGMSLRDWFAGMALQAFIAAPGPDGDAARNSYDRAAEWAYEQADAMIAARSK